MAILSPSPKLQFFDANGNPLVGGKLYSYTAGTTSPLATYADSTNTSANTNPIILDARGEASVWLGADAYYKLALYSATDVLIWSVDNIIATPSGLGQPVTKTADFTLASNENRVINNKPTTSCIVTLPTASSWAGREVMFLNYQALTLVSASANVVPRTGGSATTAILPATAGSWATLVSNGTNWLIMASS